MVIFGITGNLAQKKLLPALIGLKKRKLFPKVKIIGVARHEPTIPKELLPHFEFIEGDVENDKKLFEKIKKAIEKSGFENKLFYLATYPVLYKKIFTGLGESGLNKEKEGWTRLIIEKPLGTDFKSARELDMLLHRSFKEEQIYRIDHYLGKITYQNILVFRFGNELFEPLLDKDHIDHIQITSAETIGIEDRGGYFDATGALKDVGQNHLLQILVAATMEAPKNFTNREVTDERIKILKNLMPDGRKLVLGQYKGYLKEKNVAGNSKTDTFFALKTYLNHKCWQGVPIYIRAGKKLKERRSEISLVFKKPQNRLFGQFESGNSPNVLTYRIQPNEGVGIEILTKHTGKLALSKDLLNFSYGEKNILPDAYENLLYDAILGDPTFFNDAPEVEAAWKFIDALKKEKKKVFVYRSETWGPKEADKLIEMDGRKWIN